MRQWTRGSGLVARGNVGIFREVESILSDREYPEDGRESLGRDFMKWMRTELDEKDEDGSPRYTDEELVAMACDIPGQVEMFGRESLERRVLNLIRVMRGKDEDADETRIPLKRED